MLAQANEEASQIIKKAEKEIAEFRDKAKVETQRNIELISRQESASVQLDNKKMLLEAKKEIIDGIFAEAKKRIDELDAKKRELYLKKLFKKAKSDIEVEKVFCSRKDAKILKLPNVTVEACDMLGGIIAENKEGTVRVDYSFDTMLLSIKENELQAINKILFG